MLSSTDWTTFNNKASTAALAAYLPLTGGTLTGALNGTSAVFSSTVAATQGNFTSAPSLGGHQIQAVSNSGGNTSYGGVLLLSSTGKGAYLTCGDNSVTTFYGAQASFISLGGTAGVGMKFRVDVDDTKGITIPTNGNVLIGTTTDNGARLQVSGQLSIIDITNNSPLNWSRTGGPKGYLYSDGDNVGISNVFDFGAGYEGILLNTSSSSINFLPMVYLLQD